MTPGLKQTEDLLGQIGMTENLTGMRVLDIDARDGIFTFEAEKRALLSLGANQERAVDEAASWDMTSWTVEKSTAVGR